MKAPLRHWLKIGLGTVLLGSLLIFVSGYSGIRQLESGAEWADHAFRVIQGFQKIQLDLKQIEVDYTRYLLTRDSKILGPLSREMSRTNQDTRNLRESVKEDPLPSTSLDLLQNLVAVKIFSVEQGLGWAREGQWELAVQNTQDPGMKKTNEEIQSLIQDLCRLEAWSLKIHRSEEAMGSRRNLDVLLGGGGFLLLVCLFAAYLTWRQVLHRRIAHHRLQSSEQKFKTLAETSNDAFLTFGRDGILTAVNPAAEAMLSRSREELTGKSVYSLITPGFLERVGAAALERFFFENDPAAGEKFLEAEMLRKDGLKIPVEINLATWEKRDGGYFTLIARDISDRKFFIRTLMDNEHRLFQFLEVVPVGIFVLDAMGKPYYANQMAKEILGQGVLRQVSPENLSQAYHFHKANALEAYPSERMPLLRALKGEKSSVEDLEVRLSEKQIALQMWGSPILDVNGKVKFAVAALVDIGERQLAEKALADNVEKFRAVTETATEGIVLCDGAGDILYFNHSAENIFGYGAAEVMGKSFVSLLPERLNRLYRDGWGRPAESARMEVVGRRKDMSEFPLEISSSSWETKGGIFHTRILRDITDRRQAENILQEREEMFRNLFEEGPIGMTLTNRDREWVNVNQAFCQMLGHRKKELIHQPFYGHSEAEDAKVDRDLADKLFDGLIPTYQIEKRYLTRDGISVWCKETASSVLDSAGKPLYRLSVVENINDIKQIAEMKNELISVVSHQLKTPVAEINGYIENMLDGLAGDLSPKQREYLSDMRTIGWENYRLISDLLSVSKIERGVISVDLQPINLRQVVELSIRDYEAVIKEKGLELKLEGLDAAPVVLADKDKTVETVRNLINNALKCTDHGSITLSVKNQEAEGWIEVRDTGIGMDSETLGRLFTRSRVLGKEAARAGAGLGLFIAKNFMRLQKGDITVSSEAGRGTCFRISLPKEMKLVDAAV